jgi:hypothetical protein
MMEFLKNHYEKVILSIVLLGLAVGAAALTFKVGQERQYLEDQRRSVVRTPPNPFVPVDLSPSLAVISRMEQHARTFISGEHNLFNPVEWRRTPDGRLIKDQTGEEFGVGALEVMEIQELLLVVSFEQVAGAEGRRRYMVSLRRETDPNPRPITRSVSPETPKVDPFTLISVEGDPEAPEAIVVRIPDRKQPLRLTRDQPYTEVIGYAANLRHPHLTSVNIPPRRRVGDQFRIEHENYKIVAITPDEVVLSADSTEKRTVLTANAAR